MWAKAFKKLDIFIEIMQLIYLKYLQAFFFAWVEREREREREEEEDSTNVGCRKEKCFYFFRKAFFLNIKVYIN